MRKKLKELYLLWWWDFLTIEGFTSHINAKGLYYNQHLSHKKAEKIINLGRKLYNNPFYKNEKLD